MNSPTWVDLRKVGNSKTIRFASGWIIVVPIAAKLLDKVEDNIVITVLSYPFHLHFKLPFRWTILFMTGLAFLLANIIYESFCPKLIKETNNYRDFSDQKRSAEELRQLLTMHDKTPNDQIQRWLN